MKRAGKENLSPSKARARTPEAVEGAYLQKRPGLGVTAERRRHRPEIDDWYVLAAKFAASCCWAEAARRLLRARHRKMRRRRPPGIGEIDAVLYREKLHC